MKYFFSELNRRNKILYIFGWVNIIAAIACLILTRSDDTIVLGINAWIKPMKFYTSIAIFCWTIAWYMEYLDAKRKVRAYSIMVVIVMTIEMTVITWQAANGRLSHFNITTPLYAILFALMGIAITILSLWTGYIDYLFFRQKLFSVPMNYIWGIRIGILLFVIFSFEGGLMASRMAHTVGAEDGGPGLPIVNWSRSYGDLRVAHFFGMHALQVIPLTSYFLTKNKKQVFLFSAVYFLLVLVIFVRALNGMAFL
jgi:hypothetical protein